MSVVAAINLLALLQSIGAFRSVAVTPAQWEGRMRAGPLGSSSSSQQLSAKVNRVLSSPRPKRVEVVEAIQSLQSELLAAERRVSDSQAELVEAKDELVEAERRVSDSKAELVEAVKEARDEAKKADALARDLETANMQYLLLARTVNARVALERIQEKVLGKSGAKMTAKDWGEYVESRPTLKARILDQAPRWAKTLGTDILSVCQITNQRAHGEQVGDAIVIPQTWFTREQIWVVGCILTEEHYRWIAAPPIIGFSYSEQKGLMAENGKKD